MKTWTGGTEAGTLEIADDADDYLLKELIAEAVLAGGNWTYAREFPQAAAGLSRMAARHSANVGALADEVALRGAGRFVTTAFEIMDGQDDSRDGAPCPVPGLPRL